MEGVSSAVLNFATSAMKVNHIRPVEDILRAIEETGYRAGLDPEEKETRTSVFALSGLDCADCASKLEKKVASTDGVLAVTLNFGAGKMKVLHTAPVEDVLNSVKEAGYGAEYLADPGRAGGLPAQDRARLFSTVISGLFLVAGVVSGALGAGRYVPEAMFLMGILSGGFPMARSGFFAARSGSLDMNFLMTVAVAGAMALNQWVEGATVVFLFSLGNYLQAYTIGKTRNSIRSLMSLSPRVAQVVRGGAEVTLPVEEVIPGDIVIVRPGQTIPVDGKVRAGGSWVNQAPITGESMPVEKEPGDEVFAGTINQQGALEVEASCYARDNTLSRIICLVEEAQAQKAPSQQLVDRFSRYYTPVVILGAVFLATVPVFVLGQPFAPWFEKSLMLLIISCPCALVISTPVSIVSAIGSAAKKGVLIKGGAYLEEAGRISIVAMDKTGTLTCGRPAVTGVISCGDKTPEEVLKIASAVESFSEHPLARAIVSKARKEGLKVPPAGDFNSLSGKGAVAEVYGRAFYVGNHKLFLELGIAAGHLQADIERLQKQGKTAVLVGSKEGIAGIITLSDRIRPESRAAVKGLLAVGVKKLVMLTGDNRGTARAVAEEAGIKDFRADLLPEDKLDSIYILKKEGKVAMVGDGVNDAPALAVADIGIAMGGAGTDTAIETADIALMADDLSKLPYAIRLSRKAVRIIKQNIAFSILVKFAFIAATLTGHGTLWLAVFADTGASLLVTLNGMRLMKVKE